MTPHRGLKLSPRQYQILELLSKGLTNKEICRLLSISSNTVKAHVASILQILEVTNRTEAAMVFRNKTEDIENLQPQSSLKIKPKHLIAVLPFSDLTENAEYRNLSQGLAEDLITRLVAWRFFPVFSSEFFRGITPDSFDGEMPGLSGVDYLVTGSVRKSEADLHISYRVTENSTNRTILSECFHIKLDSAVKVQDIISLKISAAVIPLLIENEGRRTEYMLSSEMDSWYNTMRGYYLLKKRTRKAALDAQFCFENAIEIDSMSAPGWHGLTLCYYRAYTEDEIDDRGAIVKTINTTARQCLSVDNKNALGYHCVGMSKMISGALNEACVYFDKAIDLNPGFSDAYMLKGQIYAMLDRTDDAISVLDYAKSLCPDLMTNGINLGSIALLHFAQCNYKEAIECAEQCLNMIPGNIFASALLASSYAHLGEISEAKRVANELVCKYPGFHIENLSPLLRSVNQNHASRFIKGLVDSGAIR
ncbi:CadC-family transcriptional regulator [Chitinispirillum alkaliphilum]|nr:CadC-family transcriptional regulator [Chitinispirillum alkaliphilum]